MSTVKETAVPVISAEQALGFRVWRLVGIRVHFESPTRGSLVLRSRPLKTPYVILIECCALFPTKPQ